MNFSSKMIILFNNSKLLNKILKTHLREIKMNLKLKSIRVYLLIIILFLITIINRYKKDRITNYKKDLLQDLEGLVKIKIYNKII